MGPRYLVHIAFGVFSLCMLVSCRRQITRVVPAKVLEVEDQVEAQIHHERVTLTNGQWLGTGTKITTPRESHVDLMLLPRMLLELSEESEIEIVQLQVAKDGDETIHPMIAREARIRLKHGTLFATVSRGQTPARLFAETGAGTIVASSGSTIEATVTGERGRLIAVRGWAVFRPLRAQKIKIRPGFFLEWPAKPLDPRAAGTAGRDVQAQILQVLKVGKHLFRLARENRSTFEGKPQLRR